MGTFCAAYGVPDPGIKHEHQFWQYSDKPIDQNHGYFDTRAALKAWAGGDPQSRHGTKPPSDGDAQTRYLWTIATAKGYDGNGRRRPDCDIAAGRKIQGTIDAKKFDDGRYFCTGTAPHRLWYPLDSGSWSHTKGGAAISRPTIAADTESTATPSPAEDGGLETVDAVPADGEMSSTVE